MVGAPKDLKFLKIGIVGDTKTGKTSLIKSFKGEEVPTKHTPTLLVDFERHIVAEKSKNVSVSHHPPNHLKPNKEDLTERTRFFGTSRSL